MALEALTRYLEQASQSLGWKEIVSHAWGPGEYNDGHTDVIRAYHPTLAIADLLGIYRTMVVSRRIDDRELVLQRQGQAWFSASTAGKEACLAAAGHVLRATDPMWGYYRDRTLALARGVTPKEMLMQTVGAAADPASGGRQMPEHWGCPEKGIIIYASPVGIQCIPAEGLAEAIAKTKPLIGKGRYPADAIVYTSLGDGTTAEGEFYESLRAAINARAPLIVHLMDDGYGISVPTAEQVPGGDLVPLFRGWPNLTTIENDGTNVRESCDRFRQAADLCRTGRGPVLIRSRVLRLYSHSSTDDMRKYRPREDVVIDLEERDPIVKFARELVEYGIVSPRELQDIARVAERDVLAAADEVLKLPKTDASRLLTNIYAYDPPKAKAAYQAATAGRKPARTGETLVMADAITACLAELMEAVPGIVMWGEDIADLSRDAFHRHPGLEGKGGVFGITKGLQRKFGPDRVSNSPIAEASIVGRAIGWSIQGFLPIVEVQFRDYLNPAWQQLVDNVCTLSWRSDGHFTCPMVIRMAYGGYLGGAGAIWHSESANGPILHHPGVRLCVPSNAEDAVGALRASAFCGDPVLFCESKARYRFKDEFMERKYPDASFVLWPGTSRTYGEGKDLALITYGTTTPLVYRTLRMLEAEGIRGRMIDLCWLNPLDQDAIRTAADDCGTVLIIEEDRRTCGAGAAIADVIYRDRDLRRRVDVERIAAKDCRVSYGPSGERAILPQFEEMIRTARDLVKARKRPR
jgi:2-oxoisovalerate dehydrogenase E1 component